MNNILSHKEYFKKYSDEKVYWSDYTKPYISYNKKIIIHGFIKWDDKDADIWGGPFAGNYVLLNFFKSKSPLLLSSKELIEIQNLLEIKYSYKEKIDHIEYIASKERPYTIHLSGTDDASYTKVFASKKEAKNVLQNLIKFPTNFSLLEKHKFVFTN